MEATHTEYIDSFVVKLSSDYYSFWGNKKTDKAYVTTRWDFTDEWQPVGLTGTADKNGIISFNPVTYSMQCAERSLNLVLTPLGQVYNDDPDNQLATFKYERKDVVDDSSSFWDTLDDDTGFPILTYVILIAGVLMLALILGVICRCCKKKRKNKIDGGDFSISEEERRANVVQANVISDIKNRDESLSRQDSF